MTKIIVVAGKKKSGKDTIGKFLQQKFQDLQYNVNIYHFADRLKEFCINYLDLPRELVYGTDEQKQTVSKLTWKQMPFYQRMKIKYAESKSGDISCDMSLKKFVFAIKEFDELHSGFMTIREVLQYVGTEEFRESYGGTYWVRQLDKIIKQQAPDIAIVCDCRFPEEVLWGKEVGIVIKLMRENSADSHASEISLDPENFDQSIFSAIIDNRNQCVETTEDLAFYTVKHLLGI